MNTDLISRQAAIDALVDENIIDHMDTVYDSELHRCKRAIERILSQLPSTHPEQQWIPCSERLPEEGETVLCTHLGGLNPNRQVIAHIYQDGKFTVGWDMDTDMRSPTFGQRYMGEVIAWMPLPEPWEEEE